MNNQSNIQSKTNLAVKRNTEKFFSMLLHYASANDQNTWYRLIKSALDNKNWHCLKKSANDQNPWCRVKKPTNNQNTWYSLKKSAVDKNNGYRLMKSSSLDQLSSFLLWRYLLDTTPDGILQNPASQDTIAARLSQQYSERGTNPVIQFEGVRRSKRSLNTSRNWMRLKKFALGENAKALKNSIARLKRSSWLKTNEGREIINYHPTVDSRTLFKSPKDSQTRLGQSGPQHHYPGYKALHYGSQ